MQPYVDESGAHRGQWKVYAREMDGQRNKEFLLSDFPYPYRIVEQPEKFETTDEYVKWLEDNGIRGHENGLDFIRSHGQGYDEYAWVRNHTMWFTRKFEGGYCFIARKDHGPDPKVANWGRYFVLYTDGSGGGSCNVYTDDKAAAQNAWSMISSVYDLSLKDVCDLGLSS